jgi:hypothetical protein
VCGTDSQAGLSNFFQFSRPLPTTAAHCDSQPQPWQPATRYVFSPALARRLGASCLCWQLAAARFGPLPKPPLALDALFWPTRPPQTPDAKKEEFRKYLEKAGVIDSMTKGKLIASKTAPTRGVSVAKPRWIRAPRLRGLCKQCEMFARAGYWFQRAASVFAVHWRRSARGIV